MPVVNQSARVGVRLRYIDCAIEVGIVVSRFEGVRKRGGVGSGLEGFMVVDGESENSKRIAIVGLLSAFFQLS